MQRRTSCQHVAIGSWLSILVGETYRNEALPLDVYDDVCVKSTVFNLTGHKDSHFFSKGLLLNAVRTSLANVVPMFEIAVGVMDHMLVFLQRRFSCKFCLPKVRTVGRLLGNAVHRVHVGVTAHMSVIKRCMDHITPSSGQAGHVTA